MAQRHRFRAAATLAPRYDGGQVLGLPSAAVTITNSARKLAACPRRWWWGQGLGYQSPPSGAMRFGSAFDEVMGRLLTHYQQHGTSITPSALDTCHSCGGDGCSSCSGTGLGYLRIEVQRLYQQATELEDSSELDDLVLRLGRAVEGWLHQYDSSMVSDYSVVAVQPMLAVPVTSPTTGKVYRSRVPVVETPEGWRMATGHDRPEVCQLVTLPFYQLCKLDAVVLNNADGRLWAWETKTSGSPERFSQDLLLDTQLPGYTRALWYATQQLGAWGGLRPGGYVWDVTSSQLQADPRQLKDGSTSTASGQRVPSWRWQQHLQAQGLDCSPAARQQALQRAEQASAQLASLQGQLEPLEDAAREAGRGKAGAPAREARNAMRAQVKAAKATATAAQHLADLLAMPAQAQATVDPQLYVRRWGEFTPDQLRAYEVELYADAVRFSSWLRALPGTGDGRWHDGDAVALTWPRVPLCRQPGGWCSFTGPCLEDSAEARTTFDTRQPLRWLHTAAARAAAQTKTPE